MFTTLFGRGAQPRNNSVENPSVPLNDPDAWAEMFGDQRTDSGVRVSPRTVIGYPPFWRGVSLICGAVRKAPLQVYSRTGKNNKELAKQHPAYRLLYRKPNPFILAGVFKSTLQFHALLHGNGYAAIFRDNAARPRELLLLDPNTTSIAQRGTELYYIAEAGNQKRTIAAENVFHLKGLSFDGLVGIDTVSVMANALGLGIAARKFGARFFDKGANASGVLMIPRGLPEKAAEKLKKDWESYQTGLDNSFRTAVLEEGTKWQQTTVSPEQAQFLQTRQFEVREVANILGLPPHKLGDKEGMAYNSLEQENKAYIGDSLDPWLCTYEDEAEEKLLTEQEKDSDSHFVEFDRTALEQSDSSTQTRNRIAKVNGGLISTDEARGEMNLGPLPNGQGERYRVPSGYTFADAPEPPTDPTEPVDGQLVDPAADVQSQALNGAQVASLMEIVQAVTAGELPADTARAMIKAAFPALTDAQIAAMIDPLSNFEPKEPPAGGTPPSRTPESVPPPKVDPPPADRLQAVGAAHRELLVDRLTRLQTIEVEQVRKAAARGGNFVEWLDKFCGQQKERIREGVQPVLAAILAAEGRDGAEVAADQVATSWVKESDVRLLRACDVLAADLVKSVDTCLGGFNAGRVESVVNKVMGVGQ